MGATACCVFMLLSAALSAAQSGIHQRDFKNFTYPFRESAEWPDHLQWLDNAEQEHVRLTNGRVAIERDDSDADSPFRGLTLESVRFSDVAGDSRPEAIVVLRFNTGGTQYSHYVYIYSLAASKPKLLAYFHSGDRANYGLYRVYGVAGKLVVELFDPGKQQGDCCSTGFVRTRFAWRGGRFEQVGKQEFGTPRAPSRLAVDVFGRHH